MEHNIEVIEGTRVPLCVCLKDGEGNALAGDGFRVYGGAVCPGMRAVTFPVTRIGGEFLVQVPGLAVGRMPWRYQVFVVEQATGVEWLLVSGEVRPEARCADASGGVGAGSLAVTGVLDKQTLSLGVELGESTVLCRELLALAEAAAGRAEAAAERAEAVDAEISKAFDASERAAACEGAVAEMKAEVEDMQRGVQAAADDASADARVAAGKAEAAEASREAAADDAERARVFADAAAASRMAAEEASAEAAGSIEAVRAAAAAAAGSEAVCRELLGGELVTEVVGTEFTVEHFSWFVNVGKKAAVYVRAAEWAGRVKTCYFRMDVPVELQGVRWLYGEPVLTEGYTYVIALQQIGEGNVVANLAYTLTL